MVLCDPDPERSAALAAGRIPDPNEPLLEERVMAAHGRGLLRLGTDISEATRDAQVVVIFTKLGNGADGPDYGPLDEVVRAVGAGLSKGTLICFETLVGLGDVRKRFVPELQRASGLRVGEDFHVAMSPPRYTAGHVFADIVRFPKVYGAWNEKSSEVATEFYRDVADTILTQVPNLETAEFVGLVERANRELSAAFTHELAAHTPALDIDLELVLYLTNTQPFFPVHGAGMQGIGDEVRVCATLLGRATESRLLAAAQSANNAVGELMIERLEAKMGPLKGLAIEVFLPEPSADPLPSRLRDFLNSLEHRDSKISTQIRPNEDAPIGTPRPEIRALVIARDDLSWHRIDVAEYPNCEVLVDLSNSLRRRAVEAAGWSYLGLGV